LLFLHAVHPVLLFVQTNLLAYMEARLLGSNANSNMFINCLELAELLVGAIS
jgi:hypothetical protein